MRGCADEALAETEEGFSLFVLFVLFVLFLFCGRRFSCLQVVRKGSGDVLGDCYEALAETEEGVSLFGLYVVLDSEVGL